MKCKCCGRKTKNKSSICTHCEENKANNMFFKAIAVIVLVMLGVSIVLVGTLKSYTQYFVYKQNVKVIDLNEYLQQEKDEMIQYTVGDGKDELLEEKQIIQFLQSEKQAIESQLNPNYKIQSITYSKQSKRVCMDISYKELNIPITADVHLSDHYNFFYLVIDQFRVIGNGLVTSEFLTRMLDGKTGIEVSVPLNVKIFLE